MIQLGRKKNIFNVADVSFVVCCLGRDVITKSGFFGSKDHIKTTYFAESIMRINILYSPCCILSSTWILVVSVYQI